MSSHSHALAFIKWKEEKKKRFYTKTLASPKMSSYSQYGIWFNLKPLTFPQRCSHIQSKCSCLPLKKMFTFPQNTTAFLLNALVFTKTHSHLQQNKKRAHKNPCIRIKSNLILKKFLLSFKMNRIRNALAFTQNAQIPTKIACVPIQSTCIPMKHSHIHTEWTCITTKYSHSQKAPSRLHKMLRFPQKHTRIHTKRTCNPTKQTLSHLHNVLAVTNLQFP